MSHRTSNRPVVLITEHGTYWFPSVISLCRNVHVSRSAVFKSLCSDGELPTSPQCWIDYAAENYDVEDEYEIEEM